MGLIADKIMDANRRQVSQEIVELCLQSDTHFKELIELFFSDEYRVCQYAANPLGKLGEKHPTKLIPYYARMIEQLDLPKHDAVVRNILRIWQYVDIPEQFQGEIYERSFEYLADPKNPIAIRVFAMTVLANIADVFPDLKEELILVIQEHYPHGSAAYQARSRHVLKQLKKTKSK